MLRYSGKATDVMTHEKLKSLASMLAQDTLIDPAQVCVHPNVDFL